MKIKFEGVGWKIFLKWISNSECDFHFGKSISSKIAYKKQIKFWSKFKCHLSSHRIFVQAFKWIFVKTFIQISTSLRSALHCYIVICMLTIHWFCESNTFFYVPTWNIKIFSNKSKRLFKKRGWGSGMELELLSLCWCFICTFCHFLKFNNLVKLFRQ